MVPCAAPKSAKKQQQGSLPGGTGGEESACNTGAAGTRAQPLGRDDPLEEGMGTRSGVLARRISWTEDPVGLPSMGSQRVGHA